MPAARIVTELDDLYAVADLAYAGFGGTGPLWKNRAFRLASLRRSAADRWLLSHDGEAVSALLSYPLRFGLADGAIVDGFGLGAVTTRPEARKKGHAAALCRAVAAHEADRGRHVALLFSGIPAAYYERLGYRECAAWDPTTARLAELAATADATLLHVMDPYRGVGALSRCYDAHHAGTCHLHRDEATWQRSFALHPGDWWFGVGSPEAARGYVRCSEDRHVLDIAELVLLDPNDEEPVLRAVAALGVELGLEKMGGWMPMSSFVSAWFEDGGRAHTLPMVKGTTALDGAQFWPSDYF